MCNQHNIGLEINEKNELTKCIHILFDCTVSLVHSKCVFISIFSNTRKNIEWIHLFCDVHGKIWFSSFLFPISVFVFLKWNASAHQLWISHWNAVKLNRFYRYLNTPSSCIPLEINIRSVKLSGFLVCR